MYPPDSEALVTEDKATRREWIGLAVIRREVAIGAVVRAAGREARVVTLPFDIPAVGPA